MLYVVQNPFLDLEAGEIVALGNHQRDRLLATKIVREARGVSPYPCDCGKQFSGAVSLQGHEDRKHGGKPPAPAADPSPGIPGDVLLAGDGPAIEAPPDSDTTQITAGPAPEKETP